MRYFKLFFFILIASFSACTYLGKSPSHKMTYEVLFRGKTAGTYEKWKTGDRSFEYYYTFADRGRGPKFSEKITLNEQDFITEQRIKGNNYRKVVTAEEFSSGENSASWKNLMGAYTGEFSGLKLYFRNDGSPAIYELLAQLLLSSPTRKIALYPEGKAELIKKMPFELSNGTSVHLLMINGIDLDPIYVWMADNKMICKITKNLHIVLKEFSPVHHEMKTLQDKMEDQYLNELAKNLTKDVDKLVIQDVNVFRADGTLLPHQDVFVDGETIAEILPSGKQEADPNAKIFSGIGKTLLPGMFDMHTHNDKFRGILHLAGGVTSVRDLANNKQLKSLAAQFNNNEILGPRIVTFSGIIDGPGKFANQRNVVENLEEGLAEIQDYKELGYQQIKLYSSIKPEWVLPLTKKAHELDMRVSGHIPAYMTATQAINQGYNEIQHINMLFLNFLPDTIDTRTPLRHTMPAQHGADLDLQSKEYLDFVSLLQSKDIIVDPTISIFENMYVAKKGEASPTYRMIADRFPLMGQRSFYTGGLSKKGEQIQRYKDSFDKMLEVIADLFQKGVRVVPGTDGLPGFLYHRELELYVKAGIPANEVLKLATIKSAEITGVADSYGSIEAGKQADLILINGNPLTNISDIRKIAWTLKGGKIYYAKELYKTMGIEHMN